MMMIDDKHENEKYRIVIEITKLEHSRESGLLADTTEHKLVLQRNSSHSVN